MGQLCDVSECFLEFYMEMAAVYFIFHSSVCLLYAGVEWNEVS